MHQIKKNTSIKGILKGNSFIVPQCRNSIATLRLGRWIVVQQISGRGKGITESPIVHMESKSLFVYLVVERTFVCIRKINRLARIVVVARCAKPHTVLRLKSLSMMDTVGNALPISIRISLLYVPIGRRRRLL